ncbi:orotidine-5'-phosphate decarboxylase, partial [bacterium]|nr:orotidine-5'-phosphate decarboxylase [candidate division CSSED10-310 bacterium]
MDSNKPFAERLWDAVDRCGNKCCVGIDPNPALMPGSLIEPPTGRGEAAMAEVLERFCGRILELVRGRVPAVKFQFAFFERWGWRGLRALERSIVAARAGGLLVIGDAKRGDIGSTAEMYARAYLRASPGTPDALTINPYPGRDGVIPFIQVAERHHKGLFILVRTSNPSALEIQGDAGAADSAVARVAAMIRQLDGAGLGARGQGLLGAVAGATYPDDLLALADRLPRS